MLILCIAVYLRLLGNGDLSMKHIEAPSLCITSNFMFMYWLRKLLQFIGLQTSRLANCIRFTAPNERVIMIGRLGRMFKVAVIASLKVIFCVYKLHVLPASRLRIKPKVCSSA